MRSSGNCAGDRLLRNGADIPQRKIVQRQVVDEVLKPDTGLHSVPMIQDVCDQSLVEAVEMEQRVVSYHEVRPGMTAAAGSDSSTARESILHNIDNFILCFRFAVPVGFELERVGPVF